MTGPRLPDRLLRCTLGQIVNFNPNVDQKPDELRYEGRHSLTLFLPSIPVRTGAPPDPTDPAEPVDPATRVASDPDGLVVGGPARFVRVVDYWPTRVELVAPTKGTSVNLFIVHPIDAARGTANLFLARAKDATSYDPNHIYQGSCSVTVGVTARSGSAAGASRRTALR